MYLQMAKKLTEDAVRDKARDILGFKDKDGVRSGVGQITTFNQLGFPGVSDKPDGWYLPDNHVDTAIVLETKASYIAWVFFSMSSIDTRKNQKQVRFLHLNT